MRLVSVDSVVGSPVCLSEVLSDPAVCQSFVKKSGFRSVSRLSSDPLFEAHNLLARMQLDFHDVGLIIVVSQLVREVCPPPSAVILKQLGGFSGRIIDLNSGCTGFIEALSLVQDAYSGGLIGKSMIIAVDSYPSYQRDIGRTVHGIFGEAATVTICEPALAGPPIKFKFFSSCRDGDVIKYNRFDEKFEINGIFLTQFVRTKVASDLKLFLMENNVAIKDLSAGLVHQGSKFVVDALNHGIDHDLFKFNAGRYGNTNSSSIPLQLADIGVMDVCGKSTRPIVLVSFGVSARYAMCLFWV